MNQPLGEQGDNMFPPWGGGGEKLKSLMQLE